MAWAQVGWQQRTAVTLRRLRSKWSLVWRVDSRSSVRPGAGPLWSSHLTPAWAQGKWINVEGNVSLSLGTLLPVEQSHFSITQSLCLLSLRPGASVRPALFSVVQVSPGLPGAGQGVC